MIIHEVEKNGDNLQTWKKLARVLKRSCHSIVRARFKSNLVNSATKSGNWSLAEESIFLDHFFANRKDSCVDLIEAIHFNDLKEVSSELNRELIHVNKHWLGALKPALLAYHSSCLLRYFKPDFFSYIVKKRIRSLHDIDWTETKKCFPVETSVSMKYCLHSAILVFDAKYPSLAADPIYAKLEFSRPDWKDSQFPPKTIKYREKIVELYLQARGITE